MCTVAWRIASILPVICVEKDEAASKEVLLIGFDLINLETNQSISEIIVRTSNNDVARAIGEAIEKLDQHITQVKSLTESVPVDLKPLAMRFASPRKSSSEHTAIEMQVGSVEVRVRNRKNIHNVIEVTGNSVSGQTSTTDPGMEDAGSDRNLTVKVSSCDPTTVTDALETPSDG